jgi:acetate kinase
MRVLVLNSGSSSIKYKLFDMSNEAVLAKGLIADIGGNQSPSQGDDNAGYDRGLAAIFDAIATMPEGGHVDAIGHRVVHGGSDFAAPALVHDAVSAAIAENADLAPLHNPANLKGIEAARRLQPNVPQVAVFDTAFHRTIPPVAATYPLPGDITRRHRIHRYGFHGTSCAWSLAAVAAYLGRPSASLNLIVAHLGAGASVTAIRAGQSVDTSMGLTPLEGVMMQTRAGDIDPAIVLQLTRAGLTAEEIDRILNHESGVKAISGEADMLTVAQRSGEGDVDAAFAREMYAYRIRKYVGAYAGAVWPLDALVFTGGIGENDAAIRSLVCDGLPQLGFGLAEDKNGRASSGTVRSVGGGNRGPEVLVVRANEELQIAREAAALLRSSSEHD